MTAVANPPSFPLNKPSWSGNGGQQMNPTTDDVRAMFTRKVLQRSNSSSSISSASSTSSTTTVATTNSQASGTPASSTGEASQWANSAPRKRPQPKTSWSAGKGGEGHAELPRTANNRLPLMNGGGPPLHPQQQQQVGGGGGPGQPQLAQSGMPRPPTDQQLTSGIPMLNLVSLNGTFERKTIQVPYLPDVLRIGRQTNQRTVPTPANGFFDSKVLSRQHAEIWADRSGKIWIRDVKSSNGTFVNGSRLSQENRESEPHELQTADHLELGIDIVSEDQKTVVHHKVAAKVEHAGPLSASSSLLDINFGDLDPGLANGMPGGQGSIHTRSRNGSNVSMVGGRMVPAAGMGGPQGGVSHQRGYWVNPITAEQIVKKLQTEMRGARLQTQDLTRTNQFLHTLVSKDDVKDLDKPEPTELPKQQQQPMINGAVLPFRTDPKARFSDPPAPPPQQPLPEKPDFPSLKRAATERPKLPHLPNSAGPATTSPVRENAANASQILQLQEDLKNTKKELEGRDARLRELEESLLRERVARESAEELAKRLEDAATVTAMASAADAVEKGDEKTASDEAMSFSPVKMNGLLDEHLDGTLDPAQEPTSAKEPEAAPSTAEPSRSLEDQAESTRAAAQEYQSKVDAMASEIRDLKEQLELWRQRCEVAETERDADRKTLSEMVLQIRRDEEARQAAAAAAAVAEAAKREKSRGRSASRKKKTPAGQDGAEKSGGSQAPPAERDGTDASRGGSAGAESDVPDDESDKPTLSRANTITPQKPYPTGVPQDAALKASLPYASMLGVVLLGMGLMAYINGWQAPPKVDR